MAKAKLSQIASGEGGKSQAQGTHRGNLTEFWNQIRMQRPATTDPDPKLMRTVPSHTGEQSNDFRPFALPKLIRVRELCGTFGVTPGWVYKRTHKEKCHRSATQLFASAYAVSASIRPRFAPTSGLASGTVPVLGWYTRRKCPKQRKGAFQIDQKAYSDRQCPVA